MVSVAYGVTITLLTEARNNTTGVTTLVDDRTLSGCVLSPVTESAVSSTVDDTGATVTTRRTLFPPAGSGIGAGRRMRLEDGSVWQAVSDAGEWRSPFTGWAPGDQVELKRVSPPP